MYKIGDKLEVICIDGDFGQYFEIGEIVEVTENGILPNKNYYTKIKQRHTTKGFYYPLEINYSTRCLALALKEVPNNYPRREERDEN